MEIQTGRAADLEKLETQFNTALEGLALSVEQRQTVLRIFLEVVCGELEESALIKLRKQCAKAPKPSEFATALCGMIERRLSKPPSRRTKASN